MNNPVKSIKLDVEVSAAAGFRAGNMHSTELCTKLNKAIHRVLQTEDVAIRTRISYHRIKHDRSDIELADIAYKSEGTRLDSPFPAIRVIAIPGQFEGKGGQVLINDTFQKLTCSGRNQAEIQAIVRYVLRLAYLKKFKIFTLEGKKSQSAKPIPSSKKLLYEFLRSFFISEGLEVELGK